MGSCLPRSQTPASGEPSQDLSDPKIDHLFTNIFPEAVEQQTMSILLVFAKDDKQCLSFQQAAKLAKYKCNVVTSMDLIWSSCTEHSPNVIIVDTRQADQIESLCKTFSTLRNRESLILVAVLESLPPSNDDKTYSAVMPPLIKAGFTRQFVENVSLRVCLMELQCIERGELQNRFQFQTAHSFMVAVESCSDSIEITDAKNEIKYVNGSFERLFGCTKKDAIGTTFLALTSCKHSTDQNTIEDMKSQMQQGIPWKGVITVCKKDGEPCIHWCHSIPILGQSGHVKNFVVVRKEIVNTFRSARSGSLDMMSRRNIAASSHMTLSIEAPMTKVIHMISLIQSTCPSDVAESLDNVLQALRSSDLYVPMKTDDLDNQMTSELLQGLMTAPTMRWPSSDMRTEPQKKSNAFHFPKLPQIGYSQLPLKAQALLSRESKWDFNIIELEKITEKKPLQFLCMKTFERFGVAEFLKIDRGTLHQWLRVIESHYPATNSYHNSTHAGDVLHATSYFIGLDILRDMLAVDEKVSLLIAAVIHDLDHPGKTNAYLINSNSYMALLYNDLTVLESHHVSFAFRLTHQDVGIDIFKNLHRDDYRGVRHQIIDCVLATEMSKHMEHLSRFMHNIVDQSVAEMFSRPHSAVPSGNLDKSTIIKRMLIKCADVSNSARPRALSITWAERISEEYFQQTDDERAKGLPVVMPLFDRRTCSIAKSQLSFMNLFIMDMFDVWHSFCKVPELISQIRSNHEYWKQLAITTSSNFSLTSKAPAVPRTSV